jgi:type II secretory pathway pseudopilin PulG
MRKPVFGDSYKEMDIAEQTSNHASSAVEVAAANAKPHEPKEEPMSSRLPGEAEQSPKPDAHQLASELKAVLSTREEHQSRGPLVVAIVVLLLLVGALSLALVGSLFYSARVVSDADAKLRVAQEAQRRAAETQTQIVPSPAPEIPTPSPQAPTPPPQDAAPSPDVSAPSPQVRAPWLEEMRRRCQSDPDCLNFLFARDFLESNPPGLTKLQQDAAWANEFQGLRVNWTGTVEEIRQGIFGDTVIAYVSCGRSRDVRVKVVFPPSQTSQLLRLRKGQTVTFRGPLDSFGGLDYSFQIKEAWLP